MPCGSADADVAPSRQLDAWSALHWLEGGYAVFAWRECTEASKLGSYALAAESLTAHYLLPHHISH